MTPGFLQQRRWGRTDLVTSAVGYGAAHLSVAGRPGQDEALALLTELLAAGVTLFDTADTYCLGPQDVHHNERLLSTALRAAGNPPAVVICTKGGTLRTESGWAIDGRPDRLYRAICGSYEALGEQPIPVWQHHWPDPRYTIPQMLAPVRRALDEGLVRHVGVGNYSVQQLAEACDVLPVVSVQNQYNYWHREIETNGLLDFCERHDLVLLPWRPLGGPGLAQRLPEIAPLRQVADKRGVSCACLTIAWLMGRAGCIVPIPGGRDRSHLRDLLGAARLQLDPEELRTLDALQIHQLPPRQSPETELPLAGDDGPIAEIPTA